LVKLLLRGRWADGQNDARRKPFNTGGEIARESSWSDARKSVTCP
jgi:hypothetical protein